ncbi:HoxN/HupN/NixA family nickel/cobalt transporter [Lactobacillus sp. UCMA15818]|uniref:HoxN/HupN/NixA family nickel/cobalt transporter n=1 Tax=Lactobacillus sp. UCMA15818 TaxID=2583394 RepID=UPI0025B06030|nr:HoxN/HupN/NixA family nickel/cobalt transporter [Lactobacillus sp. UCMA15818]MDN2454214.1 HoxN/HupN/NixA family nickel/cobalt transporter [Lactobacillus sp. UCMA15818]
MLSQSVKKVFPYYEAVLLSHIIGIVLLSCGARHFPEFWGLGLLAYLFGLRHAFDADHIAAIDNTVRKLIQQKSKAEGVGYFFSLGHSTIVFVMVIAVCISLKWIKIKLPLFETIGGTIGSAVSGIFLVSIAVINLIIFIDLWRALKLTNKNDYDEYSLDNLLLSRGILIRIVAPIFRVVSKQSQMYLVGLLFGLGFDTASEISVIAISATAAKSNISYLGIISLPIIFASGMSLMDTTDSIMMASAYKWALDTPFKKIKYNLTVTSISILAAFTIGMFELLQVTAQSFSLKNGVIKLIQEVNIDWLGYGLWIILTTIWIISYIIWMRIKKEAKI